MSVPKFTKGPWESQLTRVYGGNKLLFSQDWWDSPDELNQAKANAALAAAAPKMYAMLEAIAKEMGDCRILLRGQSIQDLLAKARGEE